MNDAPNTVDVLLTGKTLQYADIDQATATFAGLTRLLLWQQNNRIYVFLRPEIV